MIAYFDTSALIPLLVEEPASEAAERTWTLSERVASARVLYPETRAALAAATRSGRITATQHSQAKSGLEQLILQLDSIELSDIVCRRAGSLAEAFELRGYDAVHLAASETIADASTVFVSGDRSLREAAHSLGLAVATLG